MTHVQTNRFTDPGLAKEPGASTPNAFTPKDPASEQPNGPPELVKCIWRIFSTARETPNLAQCAPALNGSSITEQVPAHNETPESKPNKRPPNRETTVPAKELTTPKHRAHIRDVECCGPGDWEQPNPLKTDSSPLLNSKTGHSSRQSLSPSPVRAAEHSTPPDEEKIRNASWKPQDGTASLCEYASPFPHVYIVSLAINVYKKPWTKHNAPMVATNNTNNSPLQHRAETEGALELSPQPMVPGETHGHTATCTPVNMLSPNSESQRTNCQNNYGSQLITFLKNQQPIQHQHNY